MPSETPKLDELLKDSPYFTTFSREMFAAARAELAALREQVKQLEDWKREQQRALLKCSAMLLEAGYKGDGIIDGLKWALDDARELREIGKDIQECDEQIKKHARNAALDECKAILCDTTDFPDLHSGQMRLGLRCGVEDRDINCRYEAAEYGFDDATERCAEWVSNKIAELDQLKGV